MSRRTQERQQPNVSATSAVSIPASRAAATRSRKSIEYVAIARNLPVVLIVRVSITHFTRWRYG